MSEPLHLYYFPTSYYTQKVLVALKERQLPHKKTLVSLISNEVNEPWYLRINPNGQVPTLKVGGRVVLESEVIVDELDKQEGGKGPHLVPDPGTPVGQSVAAWRAKIDSIPAEVITYGVMLNPELHTPGLKVWKSLLKTKGDYYKLMHKHADQLEALKEKSPDLVEALDKKIPLIRARGGGDDRHDVGNVKAMFHTMEAVLDDVESHLKTIRGEDPASTWLCGPDFTAADINLCILLGRVDMLGYLDTYVSPTTRPTLHLYWQQALARPSVSSTIDVFTALRNHYVVAGLKRLAAGAVVAAAVAAVGVFVAQRYK